MRWLLIGILQLGFRLLLSLRYRVEVKGLDEIRSLQKTLILPNHPAYNDPPLVLVCLWALRPRPMLLAGMFRHPLIRWLPGALGALQIPDLKQPSAQARRETQGLLEAVVAGLRTGRNHILWPAGQAQRQNLELLGASRSTAEILRKVPDAQVVLVRTRGLWGSMFSYAQTGSAPRLGRCGLRAIGILLANLVIFTPRRRVTITIERLDRSELPERTRDELNRFLEAWFNAPGPETPNHVPYHCIFTRSREFTFPSPVVIQPSGSVTIPSETRREVLQLVEQKIGDTIAEDLGHAETKLDYLGLDSLDRMEIALAVEQRFGTVGNSVPTTVGELWALAEGLTQSVPPLSPPRIWFRQADSDEPVTVMGQTLPESFAQRALRNPRDVVAADEFTGIVTYRWLLVAALLLARRFRAIHAANIGLMLPASVAADLVFFALQIAGKRPVMLNWTTGPAHLAHAINLLTLSHVITSRQFVDRTDVTVPGTEVWYLEDLRGELGRLELLRSYLQARFKPRALLRQMPEVEADAPAVLLFTSGSETAPKAVPLTHRNILCNLRSVLEAQPLFRREIMFGFLPSFHSFGLTAATLLPILGGMRLLHHPDPTDGGGLARKIAAYGPSILCGTPTFIGAILDHAPKNENADGLKSVRMIIVGAERCPPSLFERVERMLPSAKLLEGYGITECSPLLSGNHPGNIRPGSVGQPLPGVDVEVVDPETFLPREPGQVGLLLIAGPNVFSGYEGHDGPTPFVDFADRRWYVSGDLGYLDDDGFLYLAGRMKRFLKAGGEMISLPAIEEPLAEQFPPNEDGPQLAVEGIETTNGGRRVLLFTTLDLQLSDVNAMLRNKGFRGVMRVDEVRKLDAIPVLGTGKTNYRELRELIAEK